MKVDVEKIDMVMRGIEERARAEENSLPIVGPAKGQVLYEAAEKVSAKKALELGTLVGYSALLLINAMKGGRVVTVEENQDVIEEARKNFSEAGVSDRVEVVSGDAVDVLREMDDTFDLVFVDIWKHLYTEVLDDAVRLLRKGGALVADNVLWDKAEVREFREALKGRSDLETTLHEIEDGISVSIKK